MNHEHFWMYAAVGATAVMIDGAAPAAGAQQYSPVTTVIGERDDRPSERVSYRDLNLAAARDERILNRRVGRAARGVCEPHRSDYGFSDCVSVAWSGARPQIDQAVRRAQEIAATGTSGIPLVAIAVVGTY